MRVQYSPELERVFAPDLLNTVSNVSSDKQTQSTCTIPIVRACRGHDHLSLSNRNMVHDTPIGGNYWLGERYDVVLLGYSCQVIQYGLETQSLLSSH